jgi:hypothetical protein
MAIMPYATVRKAILDRQSLTAIYDNYIRHFSPNALGKDNSGSQCLLAYQYGGGRRGGLLVGGAWLCCHIGGLRAVRLNGDKWQAGTLAGRLANCVVEIDVSAGS